MHVFFSGIGGAGIGPLALIAKQAGYDVSGSDKQESSYTKSLESEGLQIHVGQSANAIRELHKKKPIDWIVYSSAIPKENPNHPELQFAENTGIRSSKRDEFLNELLKSTNQKMVAVAGTHGKTTTTAMLIWLMKQLDIPLSYSVGTKLSFGDMGQFNPDAHYFVYEADEYDRNFLSFQPELSLISGISYDHPDIYPTREDYNHAFMQFMNQSNRVVVWQEDAQKLDLHSSVKTAVLHKEDYENIATELIGQVNRENAALVVQTVFSLDGSRDFSELSEMMNHFPGVSRRFEKLTENLYTDYAHTPDKIKGALQLASEVAGGNVVVVYEGLHNSRQHFIREQLKNLFKDVKKLYIVPSYRAREDENLEDLTPQKLLEIMKEPQNRESAELGKKLKTVLQQHIDQNDLVLCLTAGGGGSLDEWLRKEFQ